MCLIALIICLVEEKVEEKKEKILNLVFIYIFFAVFWLQLVEVFFFHFNHTVDVFVLQVSSFPQFSQKPSREQRILSICIHSLYISSSGLITELVFEVKKLVKQEDDAFMPIS